MKVFEKLKNMFTEEVEVEEEPIKKEVIQVEIPAPEPRREKIRERVHEEPIEETKEEKVEEKKDEKFVFPVYFDDKDFDDLEKKEKPLPPKKEPYKPYGAKQVVKEEIKVFKPTPIISPVYGILDKNYRKEDIVDKPKTVEKTTYHDITLTVDDIRKKAYGTLEDDLENTFSSTSMLFQDESPVEKEAEDMFEELEDTNLDIFDGDMTSFDLLSQDDTRKIRHEELEDNLVNEQLNHEEEVSGKSELNEDDLFDLIDSMYEKGDEQ